MCVQDRITRMVIREGCIIFDHYPSPMERACHAKILCPDLIHARLGHPSISTLKNIQGIFVNSFPNNSSCNVCLRAKHTLTSFSNSVPKAENIFDLVHCDL